VVSFPKGFRLQIQLQEILALVVGYAMAALLFRAFWPTTIPTTVLWLPILALYVWLGLAMSGPIILFRDVPTSDRPVQAQRTDGLFASRTWAESAWMLIGIYWIVLGLFVMPARLHDFQPMDAILYGVVPVLVAFGCQFLGPSPPKAGAGTTPWTHFVAIGLLATWPLAWVCLLVLGKSLR
jgi:hypothetical protein